MINQEHLKKESFAKRLLDNLSWIFHLSGPEIVGIVFLAVSFTFFSTIAYLSTEATESSKMAIVHCGFPFDSLVKILTFRNETYHPHMSIKVIPIIAIYTNTEIAWSGLAMNLMFYALLSTVVVRGITKIKEEIDYRRYYKE